MEYKISNFAIVCKALQVFCKRVDCEFIDLPVIFDKSSQSCFKDGCIYIKEGGSLLDTLASIYSIYINYLGQICGRNIDNNECKNSLLNFFLSLLRDFKTEYGSKAVFDKDEVLSMRLDQFHVVWMLLKNIFCPYKNIRLKNIQVVAKSSDKFDVALSVCDTEEPYVFVNLDIEKDSVRSAFVLVESLRVLLKGENSPESVIREVFSNFFLREKIVDFIAIAFPKEKDVSSFLSALSILCQSVDIENLALEYNKSNKTKTAQSNPFVGNFWFLGLTEKMMDSVRGADWSTTQNMKDFTKDLWDRVEEERKSRGLSEVPLEMLLRIQSENLETPSNQTIQKLLSETRIW